MGEMKMEGRVESRWAEAAKSKLSNYADKPFRKYQREAIEFALGSKKKFVIISAPTGSGKSLIAMTMGIAHGDCTYMVHSKSLQKQICDSFPEAANLWGRQNYECVVLPWFSCADCPVPKCRVERTECRYYLAKQEALKSKLRVLNYDYFLTEANYIGKFSNQKLVVIDEADNLENSLLGFISLRFSNREFKKLGMEPPGRRVAGKTPERMVAAFRDFAEIAKIKAKAAKKRIDIAIGKIGVDLDDDKTVAMIKESKKLGAMISKIELFMEEVDETWKYDDKDGGHTFRPLWLTSSICNRYLWNHGEKFVLMSASFLPIYVYCKMLGIDQDDVDFMELPSTFDPDRMKVYVEPMAAISSRNKKESLPKLVPEIRDILDANKGVKGIVHGVSYELCRYIVDNVDNPRLFMHDGSADRQQKIKMFMEEESDLVLVSPSLERGISLDDDLCRFVIIPKAPYLSLGDRITAARLYSGNIGGMWYKSMMLLAVLQGAGRAMRSEDDWCNVYILDDNIRAEMVNNYKLLPKWFRDRIRVGSWRDENIMSLEVMKDEN